jgi:mediator of RNA polymerase II transcription subunit 12, fungi type
MTSRPVPGTLPPPQRPPSVGLSHARNRSRPSGPPNTLKPSVAADTTGAVAPAPPAPADEFNKAGAVKGASVGPDGKPNPASEGVSGERPGNVNTNRPSNGKPQLVFEDVPAIGNENARPGGTTMQSGPNSTAVFPPRPGLQLGRGSGLAVKSARAETTTGRKDGNKKQTFEPPPTATRYPRDSKFDRSRLKRRETDGLAAESADFFPWMGNHPEDVLNEQVVRSGYVDSSNKEFTSARHSIGPYLKNKAHLQTLSSLFVSVLEKRQTQGRLTGPSNFRPLPRVTLKDTKREEWLRDLANPTVPLRKLSKTIPHGIRGKVLLEQFLAKRIPATRAIWLAKCVGANEIRAFKRKGASGGSALAGEIKWVREWTVFVEQFVENTITQVGQTDWKSKMEYT